MKRNSFSATECTKVKIPLESCFILKRPAMDVYIKDAIFPPRLCVWTLDIDEAQTFESLREISFAAQYIKHHAWNIEVANSVGETVFVLEHNYTMPIPPAGRILKEGEQP